MSLQCDVLLIGTGIAPLLAAAKYFSSTKKVIIINPDWDFFGEDSEFPLDPFFPLDLDSIFNKRIQRSVSPQTVNILRPDFPGSIEEWFADASLKGQNGFRDSTAPFVRMRSRLFSVSKGVESQDKLEAFFLASVGAELNPHWLDGLSLARRFPGFSAKAMTEDRVGVMLPRLCDVDVIRYRSGLLEYVRERLGPHGIFSSVSQIQFLPDGVRFYSKDGSPRVIKIFDRVQVFWTPKLKFIVDTLLEKKMKTSSKVIQAPPLQIWEEWTLLSREEIDTSVVAHYDHMVAWAKGEGIPTKAAAHQLSVFRPALHPHSLLQNAFLDLEKLCCGFLGWEYFSVRSVKARTVFDWSQYEGIEEGHKFFLHGLNIQFVFGCDGALGEVVHSVTTAIEDVL